MATTQPPLQRPVQPDVVVSVGTDLHPFDRLISWVDEWCGAHDGHDVLVQRGTSAEPQAVASTSLLPHTDLLEAFARCKLVISHGGPSTVMDARMAGRLPLVVARDPRFGEHVDGHQLRFADHLRRHGLAVVVDDKAEFFSVIDRALAQPDEFMVPIDQASIRGVVQFGRVLDQLLNTQTPLTPASPAGVEVEAERTQNA